MLTLTKGEGDREPFFRNSNTVRYFPIVSEHRVTQQFIVHGVNSRLTRISTLSPNPLALSPDADTDFDCGTIDLIEAAPSNPEEHAQTPCKTVEDLVRHCFWIMASLNSAKSTRNSGRIAESCRAICCWASSSQTAKLPSCGRAGRGTVSG